MLKKILLGSFLVLFVGFIIYGLVNKKESAPRFALIDLNGKVQTATEIYPNKVTLVNFWYPSCPGCDVEMPKLKELQQKFSNSDYQTVAISLNFNTLDEVKAYVKERELPFIVLYDQDNRVGDNYGVILAPMSFLIDQQGYIIKYYIGEPIWTELEGTIKQLLENKITQ